MGHIIEIVIALLALLGVVVQNSRVIAIQNRLEAKATLAAAVILADSLLAAARIKADALLEHPVAASIVLADALEESARIKANALLPVRKAIL